MDSIAVSLFIYAIIIMSAVFHEYAHGWAAFSMGDPTAKDAGRLTLNPLAHIDPFGTVLLPLFLMIVGGMFIGYAKPVPYNPYNLSDQKYGPLKVALAGPASNFLIAIIFSVAIRTINSPEITINLPEIWLFTFSLIVYINIILGLFNLIPVPPLDGSEIIKTFTSFDLSFGGSFIGSIIALMVAFMFLPQLAQIIFTFLAGTYLPI